MRRGPAHRSTYHKVTRLVLWVVVFHAMCWTPFWLFNLFSSIFRLRIATQFDRVVVNTIHLFPYINCALNPLLYVVGLLLNSNWVRVELNNCCKYRRKQRTSASPSDPSSARAGHVGLTS